MKKIISLLLIICLMLQQNTTIFASSKANEYVMNEQESKMVHYMQAGNNKLLCSTNNYWYMQFVNEFRESALDMYLLSMADKLISTGVEPDKQLYTQTLITLMATYEMDNANDISEQKKFDNTKDLKSYFMDTKDIVSKTVAVITGNNNNAQEFEKILNTAIGTLSTQIDNVDNWLEGIIGLDTILEDYSAFDEILTLLENEGTGELKSAASDLKNALKKSVELRIETYTKIQDENYTNNFEDFIFNGYFFDAMKLTDEYDNDESVRFFTDKSKKITDKISLLKDSWELGLSIGKMIGNLTIGAEDLIYRTRESMAICDISKILQLNILSKGNEFYSILGKSQSQEIIESFVYLSNFLIQCRFRGEYNIYSIIVSDAKLASVLNQNNNEETKKLYNEKLNNIISIQNVLNSINKNIENFESQIIGSWRINSEKTMNENGVSMIDIFGTSYKYGSEMNINDDGTFSYDIGAGVGGDGTWTINSNQLTYDIVHTDDQAEENGIIMINNIDSSEPFLSMELNGYTIIWEKSNAASLFESMPSNFAFASGVGAWSTELTLNSDGSFTGYYHDSEMGDSNDAYPDGTVYICNFTGKFTVPVQINDYTYSLKLESLQTEGNSGEEYYENNQRFVYSEPYGLENANELLIYTPGSPISELPEDLTIWLNTILTSDDKELPCFVIFSVNDQSAFVGYDDVKSETDSSQNTNDGNTLIENARSQVLEHYTELWNPKGSYTCFDAEDSISGDEVTFVLRYAMSDEEAEERIANGGTPSANTLVTLVIVNLNSGEVYDVNGYADSWYLEF